MSAVYARCIRRFLYTLSRVEISVYAVYPDTCGRSYAYIFLYADVTVSEPVFFPHALLTNPLRCPDTNRIRVDGRIRFVYATCGRRYFCIRIKKNLRIQKSSDTCGRGIKRHDVSATSTSLVSRNTDHAINVTKCPPNASSQVRINT